MITRNLVAIRNRAFRVFRARHNTFQAEFTCLKTGSIYTSREALTLEEWLPGGGAVPARGDLRGNNSRNCPWNNSGMVLTGLRACPNFSNPKGSNMTYLHDLASIRRYLRFHPQFARSMMAYSAQCAGNLSGGGTLCMPWTIEGSNLWRIVERVNCRKHNSPKFWRAVNALAVEASRANQS